MAMLVKEWNTFRTRNKTRYCRFLDYSDYPEDLTQLIAPILENNMILLLAPEWLI
jgi:hypothetical protein